MKNSEIMSDAIGRISEKYVNEYTEYAEHAEHTKSGEAPIDERVNTGDSTPSDERPELRQSRRPPHRKRTKIAVIAAAAVVAVALMAAIIPAMLRPGINIHDSINPNAPDWVSADVIKGNGGESIMHVVNGALDPDAATYVPKNQYIKEHKSAAEAVLKSELAYAWDINIRNLKKNSSPDSLLFRGFVTQTDTYSFDRDVTVIDGLVVSYDAASGTTSYRAYGTTSVQIVRKRTVVNIVTVQITGIMKDKNTTGYEVGDTIRLYSEYSYAIPDDWREEYPPDLECASCAPSYGDAELVFSANRLKDNSTSISSAVRDAGIFSGDVWYSDAVCTYEGYLNGTYDPVQKNFPVEE